MRHFCQLLEKFLTKWVSQYRSTNDVVKKGFISSSEPRKLQGKFLEETAEYDLRLIDSFQSLLEEEVIFKQGFNGTLWAEQNESLRFLILKVRIFLGALLAQLLRVDRLMRKELNNRNESTRTVEQKPHSPLSRK
ncbi:MAG: hypothetical protein A3G87_08160 [Omnitrophica bacterium RIFCSPLOWO2_12_FULL_50_11]|nr:MAG: hypothetical protein A3G87_08160 [Omnitrophica bacterium RIFCSPLOWO2_12_FULL_50_11]